MIDLVHDISESYRKLIYACSYPGDVVNISDYCVNNTIKCKLSNELMLFALMLLDAEVGFCVVGVNSDEIISLLKHLTYAKEKNLEEADFIFVLNDATKEEKHNAIKLAKVGDLIDPHLSATIIYEADSVVEGDMYQLEGTGIKGTKRVNMQVVDEWFNLREQKNKEFPIGIEVYFVDSLGNLLALPRTTKVSIGGN